MTPVRTLPPEFYKFGVILGALMALAPLAIDMYLPSFPAMARDLAAEPALVQATVATYFVGMALGQPLYGPWADRVGRRIPLLTGLALFIAASLGAAMAPSIGSLLVLRFLQALGGCAPMMITRAVVRDRFEQTHAAQVLSLLMLVMGVAPILAPLLGGWLLLATSWRAIFLVLGGFAALAVAMVLVWLPETLPAERRQRHGPAAILQTYGTLLSDRVFMTYALAGSLVMAGMFAYIAGSPFVFIEVFGVAPDHYGYVFGANAVGIIAASQINARLVARFSADRLLRAVLVGAALAGTALILVATWGLGFAAYLLPLFLFVASIGVVVPLTTVLAMAPHGQRAGSASALIGTLQFGSGALAGALVGAFHDGTAVPMAAVVGGCGLAALAVERVLRPTA